MKKHHEILLSNIDGLAIRIAEITQTLNEVLKDRNVIILKGKYKGRNAQIQYYYWSHGNYVHIKIYKKNNKGFILAENQAEYRRFENLELIE